MRINMGTPPPSNEHRGCGCGWIEAESSSYSGRRFDRPFSREQALNLCLPFDGIGVRHPGVTPMPEPDSQHAIHSHIM